MALLVICGALATLIMGIGLSLEQSSSLFFPLAGIVALSILGFGAAMRMIPSIHDMFIKAEMYGKDLNKPDQPKLPEALGVIVGAIYLVILVLFIPLRFSEFFFSQQVSHELFVQFICALLSICCMLLLGFVDDVFDLKWRHKLVFPSLATLPLLMVYMTTFGSTTVVLPTLAHPWMGESVDLGVLFYVYMGMLAVFCTNAINIYAGVNGIEAGQSLVIALSVISHCAIQLVRAPTENSDSLMALVFLVPFAAVTSALLFHNWCPARVFVGDTFCYFAGMTFAVVGILGHFSKTLLLFFLPQTFNFILSLPQLFRLVPCPRHRMPRLNPKTGLLEPSVAIFPRSELGRIGSVILPILRITRLASVSETADGTITMSNLTIITIALRLLGPRQEGRLAFSLLAFQVLCSVLAFGIRYGLAAIVYEKVQ
eukprot:m.10672 g.10672  ORF g.10672 m.10672 type:complete len:427 (+) comp5651_c0_seq1:22-1302(+)